MIKFIKILKYELRPDGVNLYDYITGVTTQKIDPPSLKKGGLLIDADVVYHSTLKRATDCIREIPSVEYIPLVQLREIPFDLKQMASQEEWSKYGSILVRKKFKEMFIADKLLILRDVLMSEIKSVLTAINKRQGEEISVISHSFRLKLIEAFIMTKGEIENKPQLIENFIKNEEKTYEFGGGFNIESLE